jgi:hypothetical protein
MPALAYDQVVVDGDAEGLATSMTCAFKALHAVEDASRDGLRRVLRYVPVSAPSGIHPGGIRSNFCNEESIVSHAWPRMV